MRADLTPPRVLSMVSGEMAAQVRESEARAYERDVVEKVLAGDRAAYRALVERHHRRVYAIICRMVGSPTDAEDLAQQAFLSAFSALGDFDPALPFKAWINRIALNLAKDYLKSKKRTETSLPDGVASGEACFAGALPDPEGHTEHGMRRAVLHKALDELPVKDREVIVLKDLEEMSYEEMRGILKRPVTALKIRVVRARKRLRALLEGLGVDDV